VKNRRKDNSYMNSRSVKWRNTQSAFQYSRQTESNVNKRMTAAGYIKNLLSVHIHTLCSSSEAFKNKDILNKFLTVCRETWGFSDLFQITLFILRVVLNFHWFQFKNWWALSTTNSSSCVELIRHVYKKVYSILVLRVSKWNLKGTWHTH